MLTEHQQSIVLRYWENKHKEVTTLRFWNYFTVYVAICTTYNFNSTIKWLGRIDSEESSANNLYKWSVR